MSPGVFITAAYKSGLQVTLQHGPSGVKLITDAPQDNGGSGSSFSPTDLVAAALASCILTTMALTAVRENLPWGEASVTIEKRMTPPPRRIGELVLQINMPSKVSAEYRTKFEKIAHECPVTRSLHPDVKLTVKFTYPA